LEGWADQLLGKFGPCNAVSVKQLVQVLDNVCFQVHVACWDPINNTLHRGGNFAQYPQLLASIGQLGALQVRHAEVQISNEVKIYHGEGWSWELRCRKDCKWSPFTRHDKFTITKFSFVAHGDVVWFGIRHFVPVGSLAGDLNWRGRGFSRKNAWPHRLFTAMEELDPDVYFHQACVADVDFPDCHSGVLVAS